MKSFPWVSDGITLICGGYLEIGNMIIISAAIRPVTWAPTADSALFSAPNSYQADAPLNIYHVSAYPNTLSSACRIYGGLVRAGITMTIGEEYSIQGAYIKQ